MTADRTQCPICLSAKVTSISANLYVCNPCGIAFNTAYSQKQYNDSYFLDEYCNQYGKTYLEDFDNIYALSKKRLALILNYIKIKNDTSTFSLLDIGSATGIFLQCAKDSGIHNVTGIEISEYASRYCRKQFQIPVIRSSFTDITLSKNYDIITAWFFIEHCNDPLSVLQKIYDALSKGGLFAFSVPSIFGPLFNFNKLLWINTHPVDHRMDFSPSGAKKILKKCGFRKIYIRPAGIHPERVISSHSLLFKPFSFLYKFFSMLMSFSDTIEVYAVK
jgi:2-polyprenyl-3-methyl-5-hydroxy-6-metoxy-1,4-benzoquinol methylase